MIVLHGQTISGGRTRGRACVMCPPSGSGASGGASKSGDEADRLESALAALTAELTERIRQETQTAARELLELHRTMLEDEDIRESLHGEVNGGSTAEEAIRRTEQRFAGMLLATGDERMMARADDVRGICAALTARLAGPAAQDTPREPFVLVADELLPSRLLELDRTMLIGAVLRSGSYSSHTAILLREAGIPALTGELPDGIASGTEVLLDADGGTAIFEPDEQTAAAFSALLSQKETRGAETPTPPCPLYVNLGKDTEEAVPALCAGVGLFRTEYLYMNRRDLPDEEEQYAAYCAVLRAAQGRPVVIRSFDLGAEKQAAALPLPHEENPALGCRGLRVYRVYPAVLQAQLRALLRAAVKGDIRILYPMITTVNEFRALRQQVEQAAEELKRRGADCRIPPQGVMIETPAAVMAAPELAAEADFFSVGTNDLTQYTYALDRQGSAAAPEDGFTALLRMTELAAKAAHEAGIPIGICGELAADPSLWECWAQMEIDYLSLSPAALNRLQTNGQT